MVFTTCHDMSKMLSRVLVRADGACYAELVRPRNEEEHRTPCRTTPGPLPAEHHQTHTLTHPFFRPGTSGYGKTSAKLRMNTSARRYLEMLLLDFIRALLQRPSHFIPAPLVARYHPLLHAGESSALRV